MKNISTSTYADRQINPCGFQNRGLFVVEEIAQKHLSSAKVAFQSIWLFNSCLSHLGNSGPLNLQLYPGKYVKK